jgi:formate-nitrite transporter family protein
LQRSHWYTSRKAPTYAASFLQPFSRVATTSAPPPRDVILEEEPQDIAGRASGVGKERLDRTHLDILITSAIGGLEVSLGGLAAMVVVGGARATVPGLDVYAALALGGLAFPIGFLFVVVGRSELFTENFLIPVVAVFNRERSVGSLFELWWLSWVGNLAGCAGIALLVTVPGAVNEPVIEAYRAYTEQKLALSPPGLFASAVLAGMVMTVLTWLLLAVPESLAKMAAIFAAGYLLFAANLAHSIVSAALLFVGVASGGGGGLGEAAAWLALATIGNLVGGVGLVTAFRVVQVKEKQRRDS